MRHHELDFSVGEAEQGTITLSALWRAFRRHYPWFFLSVLLTGALTYLWVSRAPRVYEGRARILIENPLSTGITNPFGSLFGGASPDIATQIEVLRSRELIESVREKLGYSENYRLFSLRYRFTQVKGSSVVEVAAQDNDPDKARKLVAELVNEYFQFTQDVFSHNPMSLTSKLEEDIEQQEQKLTTIDQAMVRFLKENQMVLPTKEVDKGIDEYVNLLARVNELQAEERGLTRQIAELRSQLQLQPDATTTGMTFGMSPEASELSKQIATLEIEKSGLLEEFQPDQPEIMAVQQKINQAKQRLTTILSEQAQGEFALLSKQESVNPLKQEAQKQMLEAQVKRQANEGVRASLQTELNRQTAMLKQSPRILAEFQTLVRQQQSAQTVWGEKIRAYEQARAQQLVGRVNPIPLERAYALDYPVAPRPVLMTAIGLMFGSVLGLFLMLWRAANDRRVRDSWSAEQWLGAPVIGELTSPNPGPDAIQPLLYAFRALGGGEEWHEVMLIPIQASQSAQQWATDLSDAISRLNVPDRPSETALPALSSEEAERNGQLRVSFAPVTMNALEVSRLMKAERFVLVVPIGLRLTEIQLSSARWLLPRLLGVLLVHSHREEKA